MKKTLFVLIAVISLVACNQADKKSEADAPKTDSLNTVSQTAANTQPQEPVNDPSNNTTIEWVDKNEKDFGKIVEGQTLDVSFKFKNTGTKPLVISKVWAQCGCTVPETPQKPYAPGEEGVIRASFNSSGKVGTNVKEVYMNANTDPVTSVMVFHVEVQKNGK